MFNRVHLVACSKTKSLTPGRIPARDRYTSPLFRLSLAAAEASEADHIYIVSAAHGLLPIDDPIEWYDDTLRDRSKRARVAFGYQVVDNLVKRHGRLLDVTIWAGADYSDPIRAALFAIGNRSVRRPLHRLPVGERLAFLKRLTERL